MKHLQRNLTVTYQLRTFNFVELTSDVAARRTRFPETTLTQLLFDATFAQTLLIVIIQIALKMTTLSCTGNSKKATEENEFFFTLKTCEVIIQFAYRQN